MIVIRTNIFGAVLSFGVGAAIAALHYAFSRRLLLKAPARYAVMQFIWQGVQIAYLFALFALGGYTPWDRLWLLAGGCFGITLPMLWFTRRLVKLNDELGKKEARTDG